MEIRLGYKEVVSAFKFAKRVLGNKTTKKITWKDTIPNTWNSQKKETPSDRHS